MKDEQHKLNLAIKRIGDKPPRRQNGRRERNCWAYAYAQEACEFHISPRQYVDGAGP